MTIEPQVFNYALKCRYNASLSSSLGRNKVHAGTAHLVHCREDFRPTGRRSPVYNPREITGQQSLASLRVRELENRWLHFMLGPYQHFRPLIDHRARKPMRLPRKMISPTEKQELMFLGTRPDKTINHDYPFLAEYRMAEGVTSGH